MASSSTPSTLWDAFLSFRGEDTRYTFTDHLYKALDRTGIRTFMDDPELLSGEVISRALPQAIHESRTYIVVLSQNYATSSWCLDELVEILDCNKRMNRMVIPVFYYIDPSVVRFQNQSFKEAFEKHQARYDMEKVNKWRLTLREVAGFSGYHICENRSQADIIDKVVHRVLLETNPRTLDVAKFPVGLDSRVKGVSALFNSDTGVIRIGIHGMGGVGKTTLVKALYNQNYCQFSGSCFLANVREVSKTELGLVCLQKQLINDVLRRKDVTVDNVDQGIELIRARLCSTKVLVIIDDLDDPKPLKYLDGSFALGSMVIITTRNEDLLDRIKVKAKYKVNQLDEDESHQLFTQHAFGEDEISDTFTELSKEIVQRAGGLPLALQVFGSTLLNESEEGWRWFIDKLKRAPIDDVEKNLMISFDALKSVDPVLQDIFLDISCFYIGWKKEYVTTILETCYTFVHRNIDILKKRCLITIDDEDELGMHDLLQDIGCAIAHNNSPNEPGKHSRLWKSEDIDTVLRHHKGTEEIHGITYDGSGLTFAAETFKRMSRLRILDLNDVNLTGSFEHTFEELRWLRWDSCPLKSLPSEFYAPKLVTLELHHSKMRTLWELNMDPRVFENLKTLTMRYSGHLTTTPDFTRLPYLETLDLAYCSNLEEVHISIGSLVRLVSILLDACSNLRCLPDSICSLKTLEILSISGCKRLEALPAALGNIESLKVLRVGSLGVSKLPDTIGHLKNLGELILFANAKLETLPDSICNLRSLEILDFSYWGKLNGILAAGSWTIKNISNLKQLKKLNLGGCFRLTEIQGLGDLTSLVDLSLGSCMSMERLPNLSNLKKLQTLNLRYCNALTEIQGLGELTSLTDIMLGGCCKLLSIAELPPNLERIDADDCVLMERLPNLSSLKKLKRLDLTNCNALTYIQGIEELISLRVLCLAGCSSSIVAYTSRKRFFQILAGFGNKIEIFIRSPEYPYWISRSSECVSKVSLDLQLNASDNFLAIILVFKGDPFFYYSVKNTTSGLVWTDTDRIYLTGTEEPLIVIVPSSIFSITNGDERIELTSDTKNIMGIHLLYRTDITMISEHDNTIVSVENTRSYPSKRLKHRNLTTSSL